MSSLTWYTKLLVFSIIVAAVPLMITGYNILGIAEEELKSNLNNELLSNVNSVSEKIDNYFEDWIRNLIIISSGIEDQNLSDNERYSFLYNGIGSIPDVINCTVYIENGKDNWNPAVQLNRESMANRLEEVTVSTRDVIGYNPENFSQATVGSFVQQTEYLGVVDLWAATVVIPFKTDGGLNGVLACKMDLTPIQNLINETYVRLDNDITILTPDSVRVFSTQLPGNFNHTEKDVSSLLQSKNRAISIVTYEADGKKVVGSYSFTRYPKWGIITETNADDAYTPVRKILYSFGLWIAVGIIMAVVGVFIISRQISAPIEKVSEASKEIAAGKFAIKINYRANDSLGRLARNIEKMAQDLAESFRHIGYQKKELEDYNRSLEGMVKERTEKLDKSNKELKKAYLRLVELNSEKDEFLGIAAHDLKNPLAAIRGYSELLIEESDPEEVKQFGRIIQESSERMLEIINLLLTVHKVEQGNYLFNSSRFDAASELKKLISQNVKIADKKNIKLHYDGPEQLDVDYDRLVLAQITDNLISNAIKFSNNDKNVSISLRGGTEVFTLSVKDEGQGIPEEDQSRVFEKFSKLSVKPTAGENSTGLGLSIVKGLVDLSGGTINFESEPGKGTEFIVKIPVVNE